MDIADAALPRPETTTERTPRPRRFVMIRPTHFAVDYVINPWMDTSTPVDTARAIAQWEALRQAYIDLGHTVDDVHPLAGLPDMVYAANGGMVLNGRAVVARFAHAERAGEAPAHAAWFLEHGFVGMQTRHTNEGQGDLLLVGPTLLAGHGFRTDRRAHREIADHLQVPLVSLELVDPRFYHLDTALAVLDDATIGYYPPAFADHSLATLRELYPHAIEVASADAYALGLNVVSDGLNVVMPAAATGFAEQLRHRGFRPVGVDLSELLKGGGSVKCCTLEVHS
ncbi:N-dimethylarginine dimethylaminohydrolase [Mycolicibacterium sp. 018/SC-01/001]|uniref:dimethylargininase n=1 Tax=Mycolicibacterium sp. 018/SC-01/001 TaxID=2592069 RepID=UPI00117EE9E0|nr:dimethylargininase [Mycolicibacterium sp. 018/SC-01/001]TRW81844.1 N-dimethylarginine dimethylaminohydrolase [Mycolicibacterium sp. 018/SC-01/001]